MRLILFFIFLLAISFPTFALEMKLGQCQSAANEFIVKGDHSAMSPGSRLWNFPKFSKRFHDHQGSECEKEAFDQALKESKEYWDYIKDRYHCPKEGMKVCESVDANLNYIDGMADIYEGSIVISDEENQKSLTVSKNSKCVTWDPSHQNVRDLHKDVFRVISYLPEINSPLDPCGHVPLKDRKSVNSSTSQASVIGSAISGCMVGIIKGVFSNIKDFVSGLWDILKLGYELTEKFGSFIVDFLKAAWYGSTATFFAESAAQGEGFFKKLVDGFKSIPQAIYKAVSSGVADFQCLNGPAQTAAVCKGVGYVGTEIFFGILTGGVGTEAKLASKSAEVAKMASKSSELTRIASSEKKLIKGMEVVEAGNAVNKTKSKIEAFRTLFKEKLHQVSGDFTSPSEFFKGAKEINREEAIAYMKKLKPNITEADLKPGSRWSAVMRSKLHPDKFEQFGSKELSEMAHKESINFQGLFDLAGSAP